MVIVAVNKLFLVRHGLINYDSQELNEKGKSFSLKLIDIFENMKMQTHWFLFCIHHNNFRKH